MKHDTPQGSVFGGYGFFSYSALPGRRRPTGNATPAAARSSANPKRQSRLRLSGILSRWLHS